MSARTFENMLWRGSDIRVNVIGGTRTTLGGAYPARTLYFVNIFLPRYLSVLCDNSVYVASSYASLSVVLCVTMTKKAGDRVRMGRARTKPCDHSIRLNHVFSVPATPFCPFSPCRPHRNLKFSVVVLFWWMWIKIELIEKIGHMCYSHYQETGPALWHVKWTSSSL